MIIFNKLISQALVNVLNLLMLLEELISYSFYCLVLSVRLVEPVSVAERVVPEFSELVLVEV
jgi:hypothetical protein